MKPSLLSPMIGVLWGIFSNFRHIAACLNLSSLKRFSSAEIAEPLVEKCLSSRFLAHHCCLTPAATSLHGIARKECRGVGLILSAADIGPLRRMQCAIFELRRPALKVWLTLSTFQSMFQASGLAHEQ
jgi:hypothetical protein